MKNFNTAEEQKALEDGSNQKEIAKKLALNPNTIANKVKKIKEKGIFIRKGLNDKDKKVLNGLNKGMTQVEIAKKLNISKQAVSKRVQRIDKYNSQELAIGIIKLIETRNATLEQIQIIADYYGVDLNKTFDSLDER